MSANLHWICSVPIGIVLTILGLIGNTLSIYIWRRIINTKLRQNSSTGVYLIALGVCDSGLLVFFFLQDSFRQAAPWIEKDYSYAAFFSWFAFPMFFIFLVASIWLVVGVTINRFVMIAFPTKVRVIYNPKNTNISLGAFIMFSVLINIPHFFNYYPEELPNGDYKIGYTKYGNSDGSKNYEFWAHCIFVVLAPWFSIAILNVFIIYKLSQQSKQMRKLTGSAEVADKTKKKTKQEEREKQMTRTLLVITFSFLVLLFWQCVTQCFWMLEYGKGDADQSKWQMVDDAFALAKLGVVINSAINCVFYCFTGSMFMKEVKRLFCGKYVNLSITTSLATKSTSSKNALIVENSQNSSV